LAGWLRKIFLTSGLLFATAVLVWSIVKLISTGCIVGKYGNSICGTRRIVVVIAILVFFELPLAWALKAEQLPSLKEIHRAKAQREVSLQTRAKFRATQKLCVANYQRNQNHFSPDKAASEGAMQKQLQQLRLPLCP